MQMIKKKRQKGAKKVVFQVCISLSTNVVYRHQKLKIQWGLF